MCLDVLSLRHCECPFEMLKTQELKGCRLRTFHSQMCHAVLCFFVFRHPNSLPRNLALSPFQMLLRTVGHPFLCVLVSLYLLLYV